MLVLFQRISSVNSSFYCAEETVFLQNTPSFLEISEVLPNVLLNLIQIMSIPHQMDLAQFFRCPNVVCPNMIFLCSSTAN